MAWSEILIQNLGTFVQRRIIAIRNNAHPDKWRHCSTNENTADVITKIKMCDISTNNLRWDMNWVGGWKREATKTKDYNIFKGLVWYWHSRKKIFQKMSKLQGDSFKGIWKILENLMAGVGLRRFYLIR